MNLEDLKNVNKAAEALRRIQKARGQVESFIDSMLSSHGEIPGLLDSGYACFLVPFQDGSGQKIDMSGCYIGIEAALAVGAALEQKEKVITAWLESMGVAP